MANKNPGKIFEKLVKDSSVQQEIDFTRLRDAGYQGESHNVENKRFTIKNICDCILIYRGVAIFAEVKRRQKSLAYKEITQKDDLDKKDKPSQGILSGVICELDNKHFFIYTPVLDEMQIFTGKKSFNANDAAQFGIQIESIVLPGKRKVLLNLPTLIRELHGRYIKKTK